MMKLYYAPMAPNPDRVRFFLQEKGIWDQTPKTELNIIKQDHRQPAYLALSPLGHVPALELDDGTVLTESRAICTYFEAINPEPNLMGADGKERAVNRDVGSPRRADLHVPDRWLVPQFAPRHGRA
jgi:glutathione S-transferase